MGDFGWVIPVLIGAALLVGVVKLTEAVQSGAFYLSSLLRLTKHIDEEKQEKPRSLSSVTGLVLPDVLRDFPEYNLALILQGVKRDAETYLKSFPAGRCLYEKGVSPECREQTAADVTRGLLPVSGGVAVHDAAIHRYIKDARDKVLEYQVSAEFMDEELRRRQVRLELQYIAMFTDDVTGQEAAFSCPNCGAPISRVGDKVCEYCGTALEVSANLCWTLIKVSRE